MKSSTLKKALEVILGIACFALGIAGWLLPILPGWPFIIVGLIVLDIPLLHRQKEWLVQKFPRLQKLRK